METITFARPSEDAPHVYTLYVTWTPPTSGSESGFAATNTWISFSDGSVTEEVPMEAAAYGGERHWPSSHQWQRGRLLPAKTSERLFHKDAG